MFELCDECPYPLVEQEKRLKAALWGEDALAFVHWVPTHLFFLHLVVADHNVSRAAQKVFETLPCEVFTGHHKELDEFWVDDLDEPRI
ncbi:hypothetical protein H0H92_005926 [Tricholoma furcatifolium]|nr:hypothetical protein H0H92_005926 [Tricholoma furcatifolium]